MRNDVCGSTCLHNDSDNVAKVLVNYQLSIAILKCAALFLLEKKKTLAAKKRTRHRAYFDISC